MIHNLPNLRHSSVLSDDPPVSKLVSINLQRCARGRSYQPTMSISRMQEVKLSPCQWASWLRCGVHCIRLHAANVSRQNNISLWVLAAFAGKCHSAQPGEEESGRSPMHREKFTVTCTGPMALVEVGSKEVYLLTQHDSLETARRSPVCDFPIIAAIAPVPLGFPKRYLGARGHKRG